MAVMEILIGDGSYVNLKSWKFLRSWSFLSEKTLMKFLFQLSVKRVMPMHP